MAALDGEIRPNAVYTLREVCQILKVSDATMRRWIRDGQIHGSRVGRAYRFLGSQLLKSLDLDRPATPPPAPARRGRAKS
jgi:excisionase family DNA binding protein